MRGPVASGAKDRARVVVVYPNPATFVQRDIELLGRHFDVRPLLYRGRRDIARLSIAVARCDVVLSWFALGHAFAAVRLARRLRRGSLVIAAGYDVARVPDVGYGVLMNPERRKRVKATLEDADLVLAVSESTRAQVAEVTGRDVRVVYNAVDGHAFKPGGQKRRQVLTVAGVNWAGRFKVKRVDLVLDAARELRGVQFYLAGRNSADWTERLRASAPDNLGVLGERDERGLRRLYQQSKVYLQPSAHESFCMALVEAMACECVPVVSDRYALPEIVGDAGITVPYGDAAATVAGVDKALESDLGRSARRRVLERFPPERRERELVRAIESLL
jgi:glycosyltransferase involved in cell wall biosynthesis